MKNVTKDIYYVGVNDHKIDLFEGQYQVKNGMAYNSYVILDNKIVVMDTIDKNFLDEWLNNIKEVLGDKKVDYLVVQHMEPDHSANIMNFLKVYPEATVVSSAMAFKMMDQFFHEPIEHKMLISEGSTLNLGKHTLTFVGAPMVHWPEVMVTYDSYDKVLFSADGFGKFGALDVKEDWDDESRRYYIGIVGKYGVQVQALLKKAATLEIQIICPLHGPVLKENLGHYLSLYDKWSSYQQEKEGVAIFYTSVYGHTKEASYLMKEKLEKAGVKNVVIYDLARTDMSYCVAEAFAYSKIVLASTTYNMSVYPFMHTFLINLAERNWQNKYVVMMENGSWAPSAAKTMLELLLPCKNIEHLAQPIRILSSLDESNKKAIEDAAILFARKVNKIHQ